MKLTAFAPLFSRWPLLGLAALLVVLIAFLATVWAGNGTAQAQTSSKLVGNTGETTNFESNVGVGRAQGFITGSNADGYTVTRVDVSVTNVLADAAVDLQIYSSKTSGCPTGASRCHDSSLGTLAYDATASTTSLARFTSSGIALAASTTYFVVWRSDSGSTTQKYHRTSSNAEDSDTLTGWSIANDSLWHNNTTWLTSISPLKMAVHGYENVSDSIPDSITVDTRQAAFTIPYTVFATRALKRQNACPHVRAFSATVDGIKHQARSTRCDRNSVWFRLSRHGSQLVPGQAITVSYDKSKATDGGSGLPLKYADDDSDVASFTMEVPGFEASEPTNPGPEPTGATVSGPRLTLTFDEPLDEGFAPPGSAFRLSVYSNNSFKVRGIGRARVSGDTVTVQLDRAISGGRWAWRTARRPTARCGTRPVTRCRASPGPPRW
jgi:hypothetical protein